MNSNKNRSLFGLNEWTGNIITMGIVLGYVKNQYSVTLSDYGKFTITRITKRSLESE